MPRTFILEQLELYYRASPPARAVEADYSIWQCSETGLEFAWPMSPGNASFYEWVSSFASYYPEARWEHGEVRRFLEGRQRDGPGFSKVLDVGCGKGNFLRTLDFIPSDQRFGLDLNEPGVEACRRQGFRAFCGTIDAALRANFVGAAEFPVVTSFHCLEHVDKPVEFVRSLAELTAAGGRMFVSTPYSPMSFEADWFDVMNYPPHHLTRWNLKSYERLAEMLGLTMRALYPPPSTVRLALTMFSLLRYGPNRHVGKARLWADLLLHFPLAAHSHRVLRERARNNGGTTADVILVELTKP
ncbi:MAG TPA: class I SAM-dependent methyltransferase [Burkholderiales bacterium]|nr:class I SAM-dependent methyltransferase [Burkholderiales bacterium]